MYQFIKIVLLLLIITIISIKSEQRQCQTITYYECRNIGYNQTYLPNRFNHQDQKDVALVVRILKYVIYNHLHLIETIFSMIEYFSNVY